MKMTDLGNWVQCPDCEDFKKQLAEKDKEIEKLNRMLATLPQHDDELRHQICEKIRETLKLSQIMESSYTSTGIDALYLSLVLDKIEGESK